MVTLSNFKKESNFNFAKNQGFINFFVCEGLFASGQNAETFLMPALIPVAEDLFCSRTSSDPASELETQREVMLTMLIKLLPYSQVQQVRNHGENLGSTSAMVGRICPPLVGLGLRYLKI